MSKPNCPLLKSKAVLQNSKPQSLKSTSGKKTLAAMVLALLLGSGFSLSLGSSLLPSLAQKETELVAIQSIADAIRSESLSSTHAAKASDAAKNTNISAIAAL